MLGRSRPLHVPPIGPPDSCRKMSVSGCVWAIDAPSYIHAKDEKWQRNKSWYARGMHHRVHGQHERQPNASSTRGGKYDSQAHPPRLCTMAKSPSIRLRVPFVGHSSRPSSVPCASRGQHVLTQERQRSVERWGVGVLFPHKCSAWCMKLSRHLAACAIWS